MFPGQWEGFCHSYYFFTLYLHFCISEKFFITMWDIFTLGEKKTRYHEISTIARFQAGQL